MDNKNDKKDKKITNKKGNLLLPSLAIVVLVIASFVVGANRGKKNDTASNNSTTEVGSASQSELYSVDGEGNLVIQVEDMEEQSLFASYNSNGVNMEVIVIKDKEQVRAAMNTCQVCNGSPYAYFTQEEDTFVCQNCGNGFTSADVGVARGGCNPMPLSELNLVEGQLIISSESLASFEPSFTNWKQVQ